MKKLVCACLLLALSSSSALADIIYTASRSVGTGTVDISITTDGTIGVLTAANFLDWTITMTDGADTFTLLGPASGNNSAILVGGTATSATANDLLFDFDAGGNQFLLIQAPFTGSGQTFWCPQTNGCYDFNGPGEAIDPRNDFSFVSESRSGSAFVLASANTAVPEPTSMTLLALGSMGLLGYGWRRKRASAANG